MTKAFKTYYEPAFFINGVAYRITGNGDTYHIAKRKMGCKTWQIVRRMDEEEFVYLDNHYLHFEGHLCAGGKHCNHFALQAIANHGEFDFIDD